MSTRVEFEELKKLRDNFSQLEGHGIAQIHADYAKDLAVGLLRAVKERTPIGKYPKGSGMLGGTLRRNWKIAGIKRRGEGYEIEIINPTEYASYVEYGHRTRGHTGWVTGRFMLTISIQEIQSSSQTDLQRKLEAKLSEVLDP